MISRILALVAATALLSACGGTTTTSTSQAPKPSAVKQATRTAAAVCGTVSRRKFAHDFGMTTTSPALLARRYARVYDERMRPQVQGACLRAMTHSG